MADNRLARWTAIRSKIAHEDAWIQQRVSWLLAATAFLLAAYAVLVTSQLPAHGPRRQVVSMLLLCLPATGLLFSGFVLSGYIAAHIAMSEAANELDPDSDNGDDADIPTLRSSWVARSLGIVASAGSILVALLLWSVLLIIGFVMLILRSFYFGHW